MPKGGKPIFAYYSSWACFRGGRAFSVSDIDPQLCDYLLYAFFGIDKSGNALILDVLVGLDDNGGLGYIRQFNELKRVNPSLKTLASIGGDGLGMTESFSQVAASSSLRSTFAINARRLCQIHGFDGVDIDWEIPKPVDRSNFVQLLAALSSELHGAGLILTVAVYASEFQASKAYDIAGIARYVDFINLMTYDYNTHRDGFTGHNAPLFAGPKDKTDHQQMLNIDHSVKYWLREGAPAHKLILGVPAYGRTFQLAKKRGNGLRNKAIGPGNIGCFTGHHGTLAYYEVLDNLDNGWTKARDNQQLVPYAYSGDQWMSYDDPESIADKCRYAVSYNLGGVMMWSIDQDDFCGKYGRSYPLLKKVNESLGR